MNYRVAILALTVSAAALLSAGRAIAEPKTTLVLAVQGEPDQGYDPTTGWGEYGHPLFQSTLLTRQADLSATPDLATTWALSADLLTWTVRIRPDVKFSDGSALTARDVAFTFTQASRAGGVVDLSVLESAQAPDASTVVFRLKEPRITFQDAFFTLGIVPQALYGPDYGRKPIGSGPYRLVRWDRGQQLIVETNPYFYGAKPAFQRLTFLFTGEDTSFAAAQTGKLDVVAVPPALADKPPAGMRQVVAHTIDNRGLMFPIRPASAGGNDITSDPAIRQAINIALDRRKLADVAVAGHGVPAYGPADTLPWSNRDAVIGDADPAKAKSLLDAAGWTVGPQGVRRKNGREARFDVLYFATDSTRQMLAIAAADQLRNIGIVATPIGKSADEVRRLMHSNVVLFGWGSHNPVEVYYLFSSKLAGNAYYNAGYYANPAVDAHFADAQRAPTLEASYPAWRAAEWDGTTGYGMRGDAPWAWLVNLDHVYFVNKCLDVGALQVEPHGHGWPITAGVVNWRWTCP